MARRSHTFGVLCLALLTVGSLGVAAQWTRQAPQAATWAGTYELDPTRGDDAQQVADTAIQTLPRGQQNRVYESLLTRLEAPEIISFQRNGTTISLASSRGPRADFEADGRTRRERGEDGLMVNTRAVIAGNRLTVTSNGGRRGSDVTLTFDVLNNGAGLIVTQSVTDPGLPQAVSARSYYRRTSTRPTWDLYGDTAPGDYTYDPPASVLDLPSGTRILATLDTPISMRTARDGDPVTLTVHTPSQYQGAKIDAAVSRRDGGSNGDLSLDFQNIQLRGRQSSFDAVLDTITLADGRRIHIGDDGGLRSESRNTSGMIQNGAIGAAVGAIIGAVAGGTKGAAIGAAIGGAGGAIVGRGHEDLEMPVGTEMAMTVAFRSGVPLR